MLSQTNAQNLRIGIDIGGTFTDFVVFDTASGQITTFKLPSTPADPAEAVLSGLKRLGIGKDPEWSSGSQRVTIIHGSTVATNAFLERKGARTALITTRGFKDVLQIGRQNRPSLYDFTSAPPESLIPAELRFEINERVDKLGNITTSLDQKEIDQIIAQLINSNSTLPIESVAVVFLFSFTNSKHEQFVTRRLRAEGIFVSPSHEVLPEYREYERTSTTVINAYVSPVLDRYLAKLENTLSIYHNSSIGLQIMQSNGGSISIAEARQAGVRCILSGPAGGVVGCHFMGELARQAGKTGGQQGGGSEKQQVNPLKLLTFDMGGTSTDVSLIDGNPKITSEAEVGGLPIRIPILDIHTIGAGGGSIAYMDAGGILRVGPESAGADPGPACYGRAADSDRDAIPTITDANLFLGRILPDRFLGGEMPLYPKLAKIAIETLAQKINLTPIETALGIIEIANAHMERALRVISVERGHDPRDFKLLSFGGAGGLHAANLAHRLRIPQVLISPYAATLSAFGMLTADVVKDYTQTVMLPGDTTYDQITTRINPMIERGHKEIQSEGFDPQDIEIKSYIDMRYRGQSYELTIPFSKDFSDQFHQEHFRTYGYQRLRSPLEIVNLRVRATGLVASPQIEALPIEGTDSSPARFDIRPVQFKFGVQEIPFYRGESLRPGNQITGPAIVVRQDTTILIPINDRASIDSFKNIILTISTNA